MLADHAIRTYGAPAFDLWVLLLGRPSLVVNFHEDNETAIQIMRTGHSQALRHILRTHGINLRALHERFKEPWYNLMYQRSALMSADIYTKAFALPPAWQLATRLINHIDPDLFWGGRRMSKSLHMPTEHKGGLVFDYWVSNPWLNHTTTTPATTNTTPASPGIFLDSNTKVYTHTGDVSGAHGPETEQISIQSVQQPVADNTSSAVAAAVMEDSYHDCKSDSSSSSQAEVFYDVELPQEACHVDACSAAGVDDSVVMGTDNPSPACQLQVEEVPVATSPRASQQNYKNFHSKDTMQQQQYQKRCSRRQYRSRRQYSAVTWWSSS